MLGLLAPLALRSWAAPLVLVEHSSLATGIKVGEVDSASALVWTRRTQAVEGDPAAGAGGELRLSWWPAGDEESVQTTDWVRVSPEEDGVRQFELSGLTARTLYSVEVSTRADEADVIESLGASFSTAPASSDSEDVSFVVITGQDYHRRDDPDRGHLVYSAMKELSPDFFVHTGDVVYYDKKDPDARDVEAARYHWHRMYSLDLQKQFHLEVPAYFLKDDHDTLKNDCWPGQTHGELTFQRGVELFREQTPSGALPYRQVRWGRDIEFWFLEGREFRSPNKATDGPDKTILGERQLSWLERGLAASDATFKVIFSATPIVGPDRSSKADNHSNRAFSHEGEILRKLLADQENTIVVCGDRHWQYSSIDPATGLWEFSCGPTTDRHAGGFSEKQRSDAHRYLAVRGGFLSGSLRSNGDRGQRLTIRHHDVKGEVLYEKAFVVDGRE